MSGRQVCASELEGTEIKNTHDETLGSIHDILFDSENGNVIYLVLVSENKDKFFLIPVSVLHFDPPNKCFRMDGCKEMFARAENFDPDKPIKFTDQRETRIHQQFGARPYWDSDPIQFRRICN
jgi:hypothetical protein